VETDNKGAAHAKVSHNLCRRNCAHVYAAVAAPFVQVRSPTNMDYASSCERELCCIPSHVYWTTITTCTTDKHRKKEGQLVRSVTLTDPKMHTVLRDAAFHISRLNTQHISIYTTHIAVFANRCICILCAESECNTSRWHTLVRFHNCFYCSFFAEICSFFVLACFVVFVYQIKQKVRHSHTQL